MAILHARLALGRLSPSSSHYNSSNLPDWVKQLETQYHLLLSWGCWWPGTVCAGGYNPCSHMQSCMRSSPSTYLPSHQCHLLTFLMSVITTMELQLQSNFFQSKKLSWILKNIIFSCRQNNDKFYAVVHLFLEHNGSAHGAVCKDHTGC